MEEVAELRPGRRRRGAALEQREGHGRDEAARVLERPEEVEETRPRELVSVGPQMSASRSGRASFARAYGVGGPRGLASESGISLGAYSKQVPSATSRAAAGVDERTPERLRDSDVHVVLGRREVLARRRDPGAVEAELGWTRATSSRDGRGVREVARLESEARAREPACAPAVADDRVDLVPRSTSTRATRDPTKPAAPVSSTRAPSVLSDRPVVRDVVLERVEPLAARRVVRVRASSWRRSRTVRSCP